MDENRQSKPRRVWPLSLRLAVLVVAFDFTATVRAEELTTDSDNQVSSTIAFISETRVAVAPPPPRLLPPPTENQIVAPVQHLEPFAAQASESGDKSTSLLMQPRRAEELPLGFSTADDVSPIDLPTALRLAGANNLQIALARERVNQAAARAAAANTLWIPSLNAGVLYNHHEGRIQGTEGEVLDVSRSSLFVGGGAVIGSTPAPGSAGNPRLFVDLSLADAIFEPLASRQLVRATAADRTATFNDTLLEVSAVYQALVRAQLQLTIAEEAVQNAVELAQITNDFATVGEGLQADADRASIEAASRRRDVLAAEEQVAVVSANLARLLRLDATTKLEAAETFPIKLDFVDRSVPLRALVDQAIASRPEVNSADAQQDAAWMSRRREQVRPWLPHLYAGVSGGGFGGGEGSDIDNFGGRSDFDVAAVWQLEGLGFGNVARQREQQSLYRQANLTWQQTRDLIAAEVTQSYQRVQLRYRQIEVTGPQVESARQALRLNLEGIRGGALRPIEIQQAIGALASSRTQYLDAVIDYNVAQFQMLRAIGQPPEIVTHAGEE